MKLFTIYRLVLRTFNYLDMGGAIDADSTLAHHFCVRLGCPFSVNKCIGDDTKAVAGRSPKCIRKTKNTFCETRLSVPLPKFCEKLLLRAKFH